MPLKGKNSETNDELIVLDDFDQLRMWHRAGVLVCPFCDGAMVSVKEYQREGDWVQAYLRHTGECTTTYAHHPESPEHLAAKAWIRDHMGDQYGAIASADLEVRMPEINRIADVCFTMANGDRIVHEAQLAAISTDDLEARTNDYQSLGYSTVWHFGKAADTPANRRWAFHRLGGCDILSFDEHIVSV